MAVKIIQCPLLGTMKKKKKKKENKGGEKRGEK